ncbi:TRAP transporter small permease subunit [Polynucleobacter sp. HIN5]|uniref:TRAP transporter small permease subunit n=1 Tax=Polynucleobacter sp. HIN5 TaxID=3047864 RepID=UPI0025746E3D|nr:TRAP transporter small permease subunit [Polynucleobacter sp. HIN5]BEI33030.1 TRAP transporter small permease subunit [Polynucleobacter sp. HIN5]
MNSLVKNIERVTGNVGILASFALVPLVLATTYEVFARYIFEAPTVWAYEVGYVLTGTHFLLGMAYTLQKGQFIRIDIFSQSMTAKTRALIDLFAYSVVLPLMLWLTYGLAAHLISGFLRNERSGQSAMNMPVWPFRLIFLIAFALLALQVLAEIIKSLKKYKA